MAENIVRFTKADRSTFPYWFAHWCAFNMTALNLKCWKFKYLFHDFEKPWLRLFWKYPKVQKWHREHNAHHMIYPVIYGSDYGDWEAMIIDWECSRFTKQAAQLNAADEYKRLFGEFECFIKTHKTSNNKTCEYIKDNDVNMLYCAKVFHHAYYKLHCVLEQLNIEHEYKNDYLNDYFKSIYI